MTRSLTYLELLQIKIQMIPQLLFNHAPGHRPLDDVVVVVALRVDRDRAPLAPRENGPRVARRPVVHPEQDDGAHLRPERAGIAATGVRHPRHVAVRTLGELAAVTRMGQAQVHGAVQAAPAGGTRLPRL